MRTHAGSPIARRFAALALAGSMLCARAAAEPSLHVRAGTRIELHARSEDAGLRVVGALRDDLDVPLPGRSLRLRVDPASPSESAAASLAGEATAATSGGTRAWSRKLRSDDAGQFEQLIALPLGRYRITAEYAGDDSHERADLEHTVDLALAEVTLELRLPGGQNISLDQEQFDVELRARFGIEPAEPAELPIRLHDERGRELARGKSDARGHWRSTLPTAVLGPPGPGRLFATTPADAQRAAAAVALNVMRERSTALTLRAAWDEARESLQLSGELRTRAEPLAGKAIGLYLDRRHAITLTTDARGRFEHALRADADASGLLAREQRDQEHTRHASARFDSDTPGLDSSQAGEQSVRVPAWPGPNLLWVLLPSLISLVGIGLWLRRAGALFGSAEPLDVFAPGVQLGAAAQWRAASLRGLDGVIEDAETGARLAEARLALALERGSESRGGETAQGLVPVGADGGFSVAALPPGLYRLEASAPGYALATSEFKVPHAGEGAGLRVRLRSLRTLALEAHRPLVRRLFATREQQLAATPREVLQRAGPLALPPLSASGAPTRSGSDELAALTDLVERTAYAPATPTSEQVDAIEQHTHALIKRSV
jgi:Carboxypeptidase regulatory-like domain